MWSLSTSCALTASLPISARPCPLPVCIDTMAGTYQEICKFAQEKFGATFTLFDPINVNGPQTHPVYQWLKANNPEDSKRIEWNFAKFLVDRHGNVVRRYKPGVLPEMIAGDISALVADRPLPKKKRPQLGVE